MNVGAAWHAARAENEMTRRDDSNPPVAAGLAIFVGARGKITVFLDAVGIAPGAFTGTGNESSATCGRLSFLLGATGASAAVDTACSSSRSPRVWRREPFDEETPRTPRRAASAAGASLALTPVMHATLGGAGMLALGAV